MLARLSSADYPALAALKTRDDDDFTIALLDASSMMLDILTFYQERLANESYLRTATQLHSLTELARLIGYQPAPGVGSRPIWPSRLSAAPGSPTDPTTHGHHHPGRARKCRACRHRARRRRPSRPPPTSSPRPTGTRCRCRPASRGCRTKDDSKRVSRGHRDSVAARRRDPDRRRRARANRRSANNKWDLRIVTSVTADTLKGRTYVTWGEGLGGGGVSPASENPKFYALRQRAALFGYNALNPLMLTATIRWQPAESSERIEKRMALRQEQRWQQSGDGKPDRSGRSVFQARRRRVAGPDRAGWERRVACGIRQPVPHRIGDLHLPIRLRHQRQDYPRGR